MKIVRFDYYFWKEQKRVGYIIEGKYYILCGTDIAIRSETDGNSLPIFNEGDPKCPTGKALTDAVQP